MPVTHHVSLNAQGSLRWKRLALLFNLTWTRRLKPQRRQCDSGKAAGFEADAGCLCAATSRWGDSSRLAELIEPGEQFPAGLPERRDQGAGVLGFPGLNQSHDLLRRLMEAPMVGADITEYGRVRPGPRFRGGVPLAEGAGVGIGQGVLGGGGIWPTSICSSVCRYARCVSLTCSTSNGAAPASRPLWASSRASELPSTTPTREAK